MKRRRPSQRAEGDDARHAEPLETAERHRLADERLHLRLPPRRAASTFSASISPSTRSRTAQTSPPPPCAQAAERLVAGREREHLNVGADHNPTVLAPHDNQAAAA